MKITDFILMNQQRYFMPSVFLAFISKLRFYKVENSERKCLLVSLV